MQLRMKPNLMDMIEHKTVLNELGTHLHVLKS